MSLFTLPDLGEGLPDATIREWYVKPGDTVTIDQPLVAMETAKALVDVPAPQDGVIAELHGDVGDTIDTGNPLITFEGTSNEENTSTQHSSSDDGGTVVGVIDDSETLIAQETITAKSDTRASRVLATPAVRQLALQLNVDINSLKGPGLCVSAEEVKAAAKRMAPPKQTMSFSGDALALGPARRAMIQSMEASQASVVPVTLTGDANIQSWLGKEDMSCRILNALCTATKAEPNMNAFFDEKTATLYRQENVNCGIAVDTPEGLFVPVIHKVDTLTPEQQRETINQFKEQAANKSFPPETLKGASIILSNIGTVAGLHANPIIVPPMVCIVATGRARDMVIPVNGEMQICRMLPISVTVDHRAITGGELSRFLKAFIVALES